MRSNSPDEAKSFYGWMGGFVGLDMPASSTRMQERLEWRPSGADLEAMDYAAA